MSEKYCPHIVSSCMSDQNMGFNWTMVGVCIAKHQDCPELVIKDVCSDVQCAQDHYLCHPKVSSSKSPVCLLLKTPALICIQGCVPKISQCNGQCPQLSLQSSVGVIMNQSQSWQNKESRVLCGNSCLTKEEAKHKYHCNGQCKVRVVKTIKDSSTF